MEEQVLEIIKIKHKISGGHNGTFIPHITKTLNADFETLKPVLKKLYKEKKISVKPSAKGKLIFINPNPKHKPNYRK